MSEIQAHKDRSHSETGASGMSQWQPCPGSVALCRQMPPSTSSFAEEGTIAHEAAEHWFKKGYYPRKPEVTNEMIEAVDVYTNYVSELIQSFKRHPDIKIQHELKFSHPHIHPGFRGTADTVLFDAAAKTLHVIDYKHGAGESVDAENNLQLMYYGIGAALTFRVGIEKVVLTIVQPRIASKNAISSWEIPYLDLVEFQADIVRAIEATEEEDAPLNPGEKQCRWCRAKPICPALRAQTKELVLEEFGEIENPGNMHMMSSERLGKILSSVDLIESWCKSVKSFAYQEAVAGRIPDGFKLVPKRATRKWNDIEATKKALGMLVNANTLHDCYTEPELKSPAQIEKVIGGKAGKEIVEPLVSAVSSGDTLVSIDDSREPTNKMESIIQAFDD